MKFISLFAISALLFIGTLANAYAQFPQFYTACVYLVHSNASLLLVYNLCVFGLVLFGKALRSMFFGQLRPIETEHVYERSWYSLTEACLAMTVFREEFNLRFFAFFAILLLVKIFHWLLQDRIEFMEQTPRTPPLFHIRMMVLMHALFWINLAMIHVALKHVKIHGPNMMILFGFEYAILLITLLGLHVRYALNRVDQNRITPWESKSIVLFYVELLTDFLRLSVYVGFFGIIMYHYGMPLHIVRDLFLTIRSLFVRLRDLIQYRRAVSGMDRRYANATPEELAQIDQICIICREEMAAGKKLPCGHIFHLQCLRSWLERQQVCPTCRTSVFVITPRAAQSTSGPVSVQVGPSVPSSPPSNQSSAENRSVSSSSTRPSPSIQPQLTPLSQSYGGSHPAQRQYSFAASRSLSSPTLLQLGPALSPAGPYAAGELFPSYYYHTPSPYSYSPEYVRYAQQYAEYINEYVRYINQYYVDAQVMNANPPSSSTFASGSMSSLPSHGHAVWSPTYSRQPSPMSAHNSTSRWALPSQVHSVGPISPPLTYRNAMSIDHSSIYNSSNALNLSPSQSAGTDKHIARSHSGDYVGATTSPTPAPAFPTSSQALFKEQRDLAPDMLQSRLHSLLELQEQVGRCISIAVQELQEKETLNNQKIDKELEASLETEVSKKDDAAKASLEDSVQKQEWKGKEPNKPGNTLAYRSAVERNQLDVD